MAIIPTALSPVSKSLGQSFTRQIPSFNTGKSY
jgi:hypothetical protein